MTRVIGIPGHTLEQAHTYCEVTPVDEIWPSPLDNLIFNDNIYIYRIDLKACIYSLPQKKTFKYYHTCMTKSMDSTIAGSMSARRVFFKFTVHEGAHDISQGYD